MCAREGTPLHCDVFGDETPLHCDVLGDETPLHCDVLGDETRCCNQMRSVFEVFAQRLSSVE